MGRVIFLCSLLSVLVGCRSVRYVPVKSVSSDSININRFHRDSVYIHDSVFMYKWMRGDTVFCEKVAYKYYYRDRVSYDTVFITKTDSVDKPVTVTVEKPLNWKQKFLIGFGYVGLFLIFVLSIIFVYNNKKT